MQKAIGRRRKVAWDAAYTVALADAAIGRNEVSAPDFPVE
jgi:hypothetical protein